jgi:cyclopropane-fatty-acyl-phospholipid synthase
MQPAHTIDQNSFRVVGADPNRLALNPYRAAMDFIQGRYSVEGDLLAAVKQIVGPRRTAFRSWLDGLLVQIEESRPAAWLRGQTGVARDIRFHYDRSNDFYEQFLDSRMTYSCAYFNSPDVSLEDAQLAKLDLICAKLALAKQDALLDVGCGWGSLLFHAAQHYGVKAVGCTLSDQQWSYIVTHARRYGLDRAVTACESDFLTVQGSFDKIASIGMFEHVGRAHLRAYFDKAYSLLKRDGLFLNHGIVRRSGSGMNAESLFVRREVFPGTALVTLPTVIEEAEQAGFEVLDLENLRPNYGLTCRAWVNRLQENAAQCRELVDEATYRTWLLYLAGSAVNFDEGYLDVHQLLLARRDSRSRHLTRWVQLRHPA